MAITVTLLISTWYPVNVFKMTLLVIHFSFVLKLYQPSKAHPQVIIKLKFQDLINDI